MTRLQKSYEIASFKALPDEGEGTFEAIVSVFGNVDLQGDRVMPKAFDKSIAKLKQAGDPLPVIWSHDWGDPFAHIGYVDPKDLKEVSGNGRIPGGLLVKGHLDIHKPFAKQVYDLLRERRVKEFSFSYDIPIGGERRGKDGANELVEVDLIEVGPTLKGANPATVSLGTKSSDEIMVVKARLDRAADLGKHLPGQHDQLDHAPDGGGGGESSTTSVYRADVKPGALVSWRHPNGTSRENGIVVAVGGDTLTVDITDNAGTYRFSGKPKDFPGLQVDLTAEEMRKSRDLSKRGDASNLIRWFNEGGGGAIAWGTPGDWAQCVAIASQHMDPEDAKGFCQNRHIEATGMTTAEHAHNEGKSTDAELMLMLAKAGWNGDAAMRSCKSAADFRKIAFERDNDSDPDTAAHWALPHHPSPGAEADPGGVSAALGALNGARGGAPDLKNEEAARKHLEAHQGSEKAMGTKHLPGQHDQLDHAPNGGGSSEHITPSGARSSGTPEQEAEAQGILEELVGTGLLDEDTLDEVADPAWGAYDTLQELVGSGLVDRDTVDEIRRYLKKSISKSGRAIGSRVAARLRERIMEAIDEVLEEVNGNGNGLEENDLEEIEEEKTYTAGYADAAAGRRKSDSSDGYLSGYKAGLADRRKTEYREITQLEEQLASLEIRK